MLTIDDFEPLFTALYDYPPFRWQSRLLRRVIADGRWPDVLALPTGSGKTSALDIALFAFALDPSRFPRRVVLVVDRRVVVDQAADHGRRLLRAIRSSDVEVVRRFRGALRAAWGATDEDDPFAVAVMRGGMPRDDAWARRPDQPVLAASTVDQVGSRLLFRGYGVSDAMAPVHAGLLGHDTLLLLDEVHLSVPFAELLLAVRNRWRGAQVPLPDRWGVVRMSATPGLERPDDGEPFGLAAEDADDEVLARRRRASKPARLLGPVAGTAGLVKACVKEATEAWKAGARAVAVVVNRVDTARAVHAALVGTVDTALLTGRMRPLDRDDLFASGLQDRVRAGRKRSDTDLPIVVVATQCIEAGADFDFDALVTECAPLDALRQRFGRLDRLGDLDGAARGVIVIESASVKADDPVYGRSLGATWTWLRGKGEVVGFGLEELVVPPAEELAPLLASVPRAPTLLPAYLDMWVQTRPRPVVEPEVALWLHGTEPRRPEVSVVWRADVEEAALIATGRALEVCPPVALEAVSLPIGAVRAWLAGGATVEVADVPERLEEEAPLPKQGRLAIRWSDGAAVTAREIAPGDLLVVPASYGGIAHHGWDPTSTAPVPDLADRAAWHQRGRAILRLDERTLPPALRDRVPPPAKEDDDRNLAQEIAGWIKDAREAAAPAWRDLLKALGDRPRIESLPSGRLLLVARKRSKLGEGGEVVTEDDAGSWTGRAVALPRHLEDVRGLAERFARNVGLPEAIVADVALAAWVHDVGKVDARFQLLLAGGDEVKLAGQDAPLAKSDIDPRDPRAQREARERSECPAAFRHELLSAAMVENTPALLSAASDPDLVLHLVASHHGWCRPFGPAWADTERQMATFELGGHVLAASAAHGLGAAGSGVPERFWDVVERYGWWGLAWLEAVVRLADHRASEQEQEVADAR